MFGFTDAMSGIPDRQQKLQLVKALLARGANPNLPVTQRLPGFAGGHTDVIGATPFLLASAAADIEMMRLLLAAGADPKLRTKSNMTAIAAATGVNRVQGESSVTDAQAFDVVKFLIELGVDPKASVSTGENALHGAAYRGWNSWCSCWPTMAPTSMRSANRGRRRGGPRRDRETDSAACSSTWIPRRCSSSWAPIQRSASRVWHRRGAGDVAKSASGSGRCVPGSGV